MMQVKHALEFYRPAVHIMRTAKSKNLLTNAQLHFFKESKDLEELYDLENDPHEINNLALDPSFKNVMNKFRIDIEEYNKRYRPMSNEYEPIIAESVVILEWVKKNRPDEYKRSSRQELDSQNPKMNIIRIINKYIYQD